MTPDEIKRAAEELEDLQRYQEFAQTFEDTEVFGIKVRSVGRNGDGVTLETGFSGTGSVASFGYSQALKAFMTDALKSFIRMQITDRQEALKRLGVNLNVADQVESEVGS